MTLKQRVEELEANQVYLLSIIEQMCAHMQFTPFIPKETVIQETAKSMRTIAEEDYSSKSSLIPRDE